MIAGFRWQDARTVEDAIAQLEVGAEQLAWRNIDYLTNPTNGGLTRYRWNPKKRAFFYEWQSLIDSQPDLARGPVLDAFLREDCDWFFVTRDPAWDPRFDALVGVFLFSRDKIDRREPSFAAQELMPIYKRHLEMAVSKAPTKFWFNVPGMNRRKLAVRQGFEPWVQVLARTTV